MLRPLIAVCLVAAAWPAGSGARAADDPTPAETRRELGRYCSELEAGDDPYFGTRIVGELEARLEAVAPGAGERALLEGRLGYELLRLDRLDAAIEELTGAAARLDASDEAPPGADRELLTWLAMAHLRRAETQNCVGRHRAESCILPIDPEAVHTLSDDTRESAEVLSVLLDRYPDDVQGRWLLNVVEMVLGRYPEGVPAALRLPDGALAPATTYPRFHEVGAELGVVALDLSGGAVMEDFDGDGRLDLVSSSWDPCEPMKAFRNDGAGGFEDVSRAWGLDGQLGGLNLVSADYDNDGRVDLLVLRGAWLGRDGRQRNSLLANRIGAPEDRFVDVTVAAGMAQPAYPTQTAAWADYDNDGDLDLYVGNEADASSADPLSLGSSSGAAYPSQLYRNNGDGTFTDVARHAGVTNLAFAKGVAWGDFDDDGDPDLYVSNIGVNRLYRNRGDGSFRDVAGELGVDGGDRRTFASWFFDYDNDGDLDLWVSPYSARVEDVSRSYLGLPVEADGGVLYRNDAGRFTDVTAAVGLTRPLLVMGANYGDGDGDGWPDVYLGTGVPSLDALMPNVLYRNLEGRRFADATSASGLGHLQKGHGVAFGDLDGDGDQDLFQQLGGAFPSDPYLNAVYLNPLQGQRWLVLRLEGRRANRFAVGARLAVEVAGPSGPRTVHALVGTGGSFGSSSLQQEIGLGDAEGPATVVVRWPGSGLEQRFPALELDHYYRLIEGVAEPIRLDVEAIPMASGAD